MKRYTPVLVLCAAGLLSLSACSSAKEQLGLERSAPDEFLVVKNAPLSMPPSYGLAPPRPGAPRPQETPTDEAARQVVTGSEKGENYVPSGGESALLIHAGAGKADPAIRNRVDAELAEMDNSSRPVAQRLLNIGKDLPPPASVVDAPEEARRIRDNIEAGTPVTEGETPAIED